MTQSQKLQQEIEIAKLNLMNNLIENGMTPEEAVQEINSYRCSKDNYLRR